MGHRTDAPCHRSTPWLNSSEGIKYAHKHDKPQLPETQDYRSQGADWAQEREIQPATSWQASVFLTLCHLLSVSMSQEEEVRKTGMNVTTPKGAEVNLHSLTQLVSLPNPTLEPHKVLIGLTQKH